MPSRVAAHAHGTASCPGCQVEIDRLREALKKAYDAIKYVDAGGADAARWTITRALNG